MNKILIRSIKDPTRQFETDLTEDKAFEIVKAVKSSFAQDLCTKYPHLVGDQKFWFMKIAEDNRPEIQEIIQLDTNLYEFIKPMEFVQFKLGLIDISLYPNLEQFKEIGKIKFILASDKVNVVSGYKNCGYIQQDKFYPTKSCFDIIKMQVRLFAKAPVAILELFGKATGVCCICGRTLTNEESVNRGIGPICAEKHGV